MIIDMHVHTKLSGDSSATVEEYCRIIQRYRRYHPFDGIVLTEHRVYHPNEEYEKLAERYGIVILNGIEVNSNLGHLLLYGITDHFLQKIDITRLALNSRDVIRTMMDCGGIAIPAHPFRESAYGNALTQGEERLDGITIIEEQNGSNTADQNLQASSLVKRNGLKGIGGSDAHYVNRHWFLNCATQFDTPVSTMDDLVRALRTGSFRPVTLDKSVLGEF